MILRLWDYSLFLLLFTFLVRAPNRMAGLDPEVDAVVGQRVGSVELCRPGTSADIVPRAMRSGDAR